MGELYRLDFPNGKSYVGITRRTAALRFKGHQRDAMGSTSGIIYHAWRKHGQPKLIVLAVLEDCELAATEIRAIKALNTLAPNGYNISFGGDLRPHLNPYALQKVKRKLKRHWADPVASAARRASLSSPESRARKAQSAKLRWALQTQSQRDALLASQKAGWAAPGVKSKIIADRALPGNKEIRSAAQKLKWENREIREKMSLANRAAHNKPEIKARFAAASAKRWADPEYKARVSLKMREAHLRKKMGNSL